MDHPQIVSARRKLGWGRVRRDELGEAIFAFGHTNLITVVVDGDFYERIAKIDKAARQTVIPDDSTIPLIAGDVVANLNAALDHAHQVIFDDGERKQSDIAAGKIPNFPVPRFNQVGTPEWRKFICEACWQSSRWVQALKVIETLYDGVTKETWNEHPANRLRAIVNGDKHALTLEVRADTSGIWIADDDGKKITVGGGPGGGAASLVRYWPAIAEWGSTRPLYADPDDVPDNFDDGFLVRAVKRFVLEDSVEVQVAVDVVRQMSSGTKLVHELDEIIEFVAKAVGLYAETFDI